MLLAASLAAAACTGETTLGLRLESPDGGDPFLPPDMATQARFTVEDHHTAVQTVTVPPGGHFSFDVKLAEGVTTPARAVVEALSNGQVVGSGATPPVVWSSLGAVILPVFVQRRDTLVQVPWNPSFSSDPPVEVERTRPWLFELRSPFLAMLGGAANETTVQVYDNLIRSPVGGGALIPDSFNRDAAALAIDNQRFLLVHGCASVIWDSVRNAISMPMDHMPPTERCSILGSAVVQDPGGGGWLVGGHDLSGPVARVDRVQPDGTWQPAVPLAVPRDAPAAVRIGADDLLVAGGQARREHGALEHYTPTLTDAQRRVTTGDARVDERSDVTLILAGDGVVLMLGGVVYGTSDLTPDDVAIDTRCLAGACPPVLSVTPLLHQRRRGAVAARAENGPVIALSGRTVSGVADQVEMVDVTSPRSPRWQGVAGSLPYDGLSARTISTGSVWIAGGGRRESWFFRH